jgi:hypothetical protein
MNNTKPWAYVYLMAHYLATLMVGKLLMLNLTVLKI